MSVADWFKRVIIPLRQRPISTDLNRLQDRILETVRLQGAAVLGESWASSPTLAAGSRFLAYPPSGFLGASFLVAPNPIAPPFGVMLYPGIGYTATSPATAVDYDGAQGVDYDSDSWAPLCLSTFQLGLTVPAPPAPGSSRIDIIEVRANYAANEPATVGIFNPATEVFDALSRNKSFNWDLLGLTGSVVSPAASTAAIGYKQGVTVVGGIAAATEPTVTAGYMKIARINLEGAVAAITQDLIADRRKPILPNGELRVAGSATIPGVAAGLGLESFPSVAMPPGVVVKMGYVNNVPPAAGTSYTADFWVIGTELYGRSLGVGAATATTQEGLVRCMQTTCPGVSALTAGDVLLLSGGDPNYTVVNTAATFAIGQSFLKFTVTVRHPAAGALQNSERFYFNLAHNLG